METVMSSFLGRSVDLFISNFLSILCNMELLQMVLLPLLTGRAFTPTLGKLELNIQRLP